MKVKILDEIRAIFAILFFLIAAVFALPALLLFVIGYVVLTEEDKVSIINSVNKASVKAKSLK